MILNTNNENIVFKENVILINGEIYMNAMSYKSIHDMIEDVATIYLVQEYVSNFTISHIVSAFSEQEAVENCMYVDYNDVLSVTEITLQ